MATQEITSAIETCEQHVSSIAFDLTSLNAILNGAFALLEKSDRYGMADDADGGMLCEVGQIIIDTRNRLSKIGSQLDRIGIDLSGIREGGE